MQAISSYEFDEMLNKPHSSLIRLEQFGNEFRFIQLKNNGITRPKIKQPKVHVTRSFSHMDEGEFWEMKWQYEEIENDERFQSSICRTRSRIRELMLCNDFDYFVTLTIDENKKERRDIKKIKRMISDFIQNFNKKYHCKLKYLLIPEQHKDGSWHFHGGLAGVPTADFPCYHTRGKKKGQPIILPNGKQKVERALRYNKNGHLELKDYAKRFGYMQMDYIRDKVKCACYTAKYITKDCVSTVKAMDKGAHLFMASRGLHGKVIIAKGFGNLDEFYKDCYYNEFCKISYPKSDEELSRAFEYLNMKFCDSSDEEKYNEIENVSKIEHYREQFAIRKLGLKVKAYFPKLEKKTKPDLESMLRIKDMYIPPKPKRTKRTFTPDYNQMSFDSITSPCRYS